MAKIQLVDQVLASTGPTRIGTRISREVLVELFGQSSPVDYLHQHHDLSRPPVGKVFNKRLRELPSGDLAIIADIELDEGQDLSQFGGYSVSFLDHRVFAPRGDIAATICLDARFFNEDDLRATAAQSPFGNIASRTLFRYAVGGEIVAGIEAVTILVLISAEVAKGFFSQAGKDLFSLVRTRLTELATKQHASGRTTEFDFSFQVDDEGESYDVFVRSTPDDLKVIELGLVSVDDLRKEVRSMLDPSKVKKVTARLSRFDPYLRNVKCVPRVTE